MNQDQHIKIEIDYSPVYELAISLYIYMSKKEKKIIELGKPWYKKVDNQLSPELKQKIKEDRIYKDHGMDLFYVYSSPNKQSIPEFLKWMTSLKEKEFKDIHLSILAQKHEEDVKKFKKTYTYRWIEEHGFGALKDYFLDLWQQWNEEYFSGIQDEILNSLKQEAQKMKELAESMNSVQLIEKATNGICLEDDQVKKVVLIPQFHSNPFNVYENFKNLKMFLYPIDLDGVQSNEPSRKLMRVTKCLADETRLKILRYVHEEQKSFMEIVNQTKLAKSTVHHHLVVLRAAGLIRLHSSNKDGDRYSLRESRIQDVSLLLSDYIKNVR
ncbi:metalloregulator ArsR/SmtB family transcription factor [Bacillus gobiensis]|uniref:ArsR/SmtB family transcription factor n=1 Tax=Bacillus gobiensis TaxID=1441095 RepID=UPI003D194252